MALPVIAVVNMKGGVGKTTLAVALAETMAVRRNLRVLVVDLDSQSSATYALLGEDRFREMRREGRHACRLLAELGPAALDGPPPSPVEQLITKHASGLKPAPTLDLIGAIPALQKLERQVICDLAGAGFTRHAIEIMAAEHLIASFASVAHEYDAIILDCPPGISAFTEAGVRVARLILAPFVPEFLPSLGLETFLFQCVSPLAREGAWNGRMLAVANRVTGDREQERYVAQVDDIARDLDLEVSISSVRVPQDAAIAKAAMPSDGIAYRDKYRKIARVFEDLADETVRELDSLKLPA